jgi:DNA-directed RNA polymerase specialized sigma24 family protein
MKAKTEPSQKHFDKLLNWLNEDRLLAAEKYESIRKSLIKMFVVRGSFEAEEMADIVFERVTNKIFEIADSYQGDATLYFYGIAQNVFLESFRKPKFEELPFSLSKQEDKGLSKIVEESETNLAYLRTCLQNLKGNQRQLILSYYEKEKQGKIDNRKIIADQYGITLAMLRTKAFRIKIALQKCVFNCVEENKLKIN